ncbi:MAG: hypothetical protein GWN07_35625, partial [Actinobacteria bacterium]|nr:hypothetical protein [Actinomycetota bacterium]NIS36182.1 hypothetical protein [Actinomycetota bacterium]NIU70752.1 hypothetical protein [Actinomycetota bacterium]NIW32657.1 hypothetical protein [Actinomycetota bacterium]NIX24850.1 hypothetical protein [Actinomycetota bacterium]
PAEGDGEQVWGLNIRRRVARRAEVANWARVMPGSDRVVSSFGELVGLRGLGPRRRLELRPYLLTRVLRAPGD